MGMRRTFNAAGFLGAAVGAILLLAVYRMIAGKRRD